MTVRAYRVLDPPRAEFRERVAKAAFYGEHLPVTVSELLDEVSAQRRPPKTFELTVQLEAIHLGEEGHLIATITETDVTARFDFDTENVTLTTGDMDDTSMDHYTVTRP